MDMLATWNICIDTEAIVIFNIDLNASILNVEWEVKLDRKQIPVAQSYENETIRDKESLYCLITHTA